MEVLYKINSHESDGKLTYTVTPIRVVRRGIAEGCGTESIDAITHDGRHFCGNPNDYFKTEAEAWERIRANLIDGICWAKDARDRLSTEIKQYELVLSQLPNKLVPDNA